MNEMVFFEVESEACGRQKQYGYKLFDGQCYIKTVKYDDDEYFVCDAARISYSRSNTEINSRSSVSFDEKLKRDKKLLWYLLSHDHLSPFEMNNITFVISAPIFIARQFFRHRTGRFNEVSGRYTEFKPVFYTPHDLSWYQSQDSKNKQVSKFDSLTDESKQQSYETILQHSLAAFETYKSLLKLGLSKEKARVVLPLNTITSFYLQFSVRHIFDFLNLRLHPGAQYEIQIYAKAMLEILKRIYPYTAECFEIYYRG